MPPTASGWNSWWNEAKKILKTDPKFGTLDNENDVYEVREKPLSFEEKTYNSFKAAKDFTQRFNFIHDYIENADNDSEYLEDMVSYFLTFLNSLNNVDEQTICSYLLIMNIQKKFPFLKINPPYTFKEFLDQIEDPISIYENINFNEYKKDYLLLLKRYHKNWDSIYIRIFYLYPNRFIFDELLNKDPNIIDKVVKDLISGYKEYKESFFWIITNILTGEKIQEMNIDYDNIILSMIHLVEITGKEIGLKKDVTKNKKISNQIKDYLFKNDLLPSYIKNSGKDFCKRLYTIANELLSLDGESVVIIKDTIVNKFPDIDTEDNILKFDAGMGKTSIFDKLLTTEDSFTKMQKELLHIKDAEIPENSKEIGWAMEKGDLKENAEFKAAKEKQTFLQNKMNKLMNDLGRAIIVKKDEITGEFITFGTKVTLNDKINNNQISYTILGPWESDTEQNIISYQSPLGANLLDKRLNDEIKFVLNDKTYDYVVEQIEIYNF